MRRCARAQCHARERRARNFIDGARARGRLNTTDTHLQIRRLRPSAANQTSMEHDWSMSGARLWACLGARWR
eukprot:11204345-Lingulodinium_polyedra.AAC.1